MASRRFVSEGNLPKNDIGWSKWTYALAIGAPVAIGLGYWYYKKSKSKRGDDSLINGKDSLKPKSSLNPTSAKSVTPKASSQTEEALLSKRNFQKNKTDEEVLPKDPYEKAKTCKNIGNKYFKEGKYDKAIECYTEAIKVCPEDRKGDLATFYQNRAASYENLKNFSEVISDCSKAIELNNTYIKALTRRAKAYDTINDLKNALDDITAVCILEGFQNSNSLLITDRILKSKGKEQARKAVQTRTPILPSGHFIKNYFISFCEDPIIKISEKYKEEKKESQNPKELSGFRLGIHNFVDNKFEDVIQNCTQEIERNGQDTAEALLLRGTFHLLQGQTDAAQEDLKRLLEMESVDVKVRVNALIKVGTLKVHAEQMEEALKDFDRAIELDPNNADIYLHRGQVLLLMDRIDDTLRDLEKSAALNSNFPSATAQKCYVQYRCGLRYNDSKQKEEALKGFIEAHEKFPRCSESYFLHAQVLLERQEFEKAEEFFLKAGEIDPTDPNVWVHRGILYLQWKQDVDSALGYLKKAIEMDSKCQFAYETLGSIQVQRGHLQKGLELFDKAIALAQTETELAHLFSLRDAAEAQGRVATRLGIDIGSESNT